jgi:hypothetical protein
MTDFPFVGSGTEDARLANYDNVLLDYYKAKTLGILGYKTDESNLMTGFYQKCIASRQIMQSRRDLAQSSKARVNTNMKYNPFRKNR